jgi:hypothetical protein
MGTDCAETDSRLSYLDLKVNISDRRFTTAVFDMTSAIILVFT